MLVASPIHDQAHQSENDSHADKKRDAGAERILTDKAPRGFLHGFTLTNFLQYVEMDEKSWTLQIIAEEQTGTLHFCEGRLLDAHIDGKNGEDAALEILSWDHVDINVEGNCGVAHSWINRSLRSLILEANRLADEGE